MDMDSILGDITAVTKKWTKQRKAEQRKASAAARRPYLFRKIKNTIKDAAWEVMEAAYLKASSNGTLPAHARQIFYPARGPIQDKTGEPLDSKYFTQTLLPDYINEHPDCGWDVVFDARGRFEEPHTGRGVPLGTLEVRNYLTGHGDSPVMQVRGLFPTHGPTNRFGAVLFIEKEGFLPLFRRVRLADRFDLAIMSTKGMSNVAARMLVDSLCGQYSIPLLTMHDFDKAGFSIQGLFRRDNRRYQFKHNPQVIDLGLRLKDVLACGLESEGVRIEDSIKIRATLRRNGAREEEIEYLMRGDRVELNAFPSEALVRWIEAKLAQYGIKKVVPDDATLQKAYRRAWIQDRVRSSMEEIKRQLRRDSRQLELPEDVRAQVLAMMAKDPQLSWDQVIRQLIDDTDL